jgi:hypothetical protein
LGDAGSQQRSGDTSTPAEPNRNGTNDGIPRASGSDVGHSQLARRATPRSGRALDAGDESEPGRGALADADGQWRLQQEVALGIERGWSGDGGHDLEPERVSDPLGDSLRLQPERGDDSAPATERRDSELGYVGLEVGHPDKPGRKGRSGEGRERADERFTWPPGPADADGWRAYIEQGGPEPAVCRGADGLPKRVDRLKALGNAQVPAVAALAFRTLAARFGG